MSRFDAIAARMPWTRLLKAIDRERKAVKGMTRSVEALERAQLETVAELSGRLGEVADAQRSALAELGEALTARLDALERGQLASMEQLRELEVARGRHDARILDLTRRRKAELVTPEFHALVREVQADERTLLGTDRLYVLWQAVRNTIALGLPVLEIGTYRGGSARFLAAALRELAGEERELHVVDTFAGHDAADISPLEPVHTAGRFADTSYEDVCAYLGDFPRLHVHRARFPEGADAYVPAQVGLVHLDVDLYAPTAAALSLLADRTVPGTVVVIDDYGAPKTPGVVKAVHEFLAAGHPFQIWDVDTKQVVLVRR